jgi:3'-phosphoadenosine 5'-phosphosulfate sulfotransferase (PAPS reductase)/FAD synthetase
MGGVKLAFPLRDWTDDDVWEFIDEHNIPMQLTRYRADHTEQPDKWYNNDYMHACTACIDPREKAHTVPCPKLKVNVPNVGHRVLLLQAEPGYVTRMILKNNDERLKQKVREL